jgi:hypothetical protein
VSPALIQTLMETEPSEAWLQPVDDLEKALVAVRSGPRVESRKDLEDVVEKLRIRVGRVCTLLASPPDTSCITRSHRHYGDF